MCDVALACGFHPRKDFGNGAHSTVEEEAAAVDALTLRLTAVNGESFELLIGVDAHLVRVQREDRRGSEGGRGLQRAFATHTAVLLGEVENFSCRPLGANTEEPIGAPGSVVGAALTAIVLPADRVLADGLGRCSSLSRPQPAAHRGGEGEGGRRWSTISKRILDGKY
eukprot:scaffold22291_cov32-Tisochrysis_lutea.AAC.1